MERGRHRRCRSATTLEGIQQIERQIQKENAISKSCSDSRAYIDGVTRKDMFMLELGHSSSRRDSRIVMKKLPAGEMPKEVEAKRRSRSVVAKMMGLDGLQSQHVHRQRSRSSDSCQRKNASMSIQRNGPFLDDQKNRRSLMEQQEFKDVYEDVEASHISNRHYLSKRSSSSRLTKTEMALQKFRDAEHHSNDANFHGSKDFDGTPKTLDSNVDLLPKFLQKRDSVCTKHFQDLQVHPTGSHCSRIAVPKAGNSSSCEGNAKAWQSERDISYKQESPCNRKCEDGLSPQQHSHHSAYISRRSEIQSEEKNEKNILPTRIVILKPNLQKMHDGNASASAADSLRGCPSNFRKLKQCPNVVGAETVSREGKDLSDYMTSMKPVSREARILAREITKHIRDGCDGNIDPITALARGYRGDESSFDVYECNSGSESDILEELSNNSSCCKNRHKHPSSGMVKSSFSKDAKKRMSERWKTTHKSQDVEMVGKPKTLAEMLAIPISDIKTRTKHLNNKGDHETESDRLARNNGNDMRYGHSGISSRDGWGNKLSRTPYRSKSIPPLSPSGEDCRRFADPVAAAEGFLTRRDAAKNSKSKAVKGNLFQKEDFTGKDLRSRSKKPSSRHHPAIDETEYLPEAKFEIQKDKNLEKEPFKQQFMSEMAAAAEEGTRTSLELSSMSSGSPPKQSSPKVENINSIAHDDDDDGGSSSQEPNNGAPRKGLDPDSSESSQQADNPSPISVLEVPFTEDVSPVSECFDRVNLELQELRMQLQLLKMESKADAEVPTLILSENDLALNSHMLVGKDCGLRNEDWKASYLLDVLTDSGFEESNLDMFRFSWYSSECPLSPKLFASLEKKYNDVMADLGDERRLLFDRINSALFKMFLQHVDLYPWVMPKITRVDSTWHKQVIRDACQKLLTGHELEANGNGPVRVLDLEFQWLDFNGQIDMIGNDIEKLLIDELITEVICSF